MRDGLTGMDALAAADRLHAERGSGLERTDVVEPDEGNNAVELEPRERAAEHGGQAFSAETVKALFAAHDAAETDGRTAVKLLREQAAERHQLVRLLFEGCDIADAVRAVAAQHIRDKIQRITAVIRPIPCRHGLRVLKNAGGKLEIGRAQAAEVQTLRLDLE